MLTQLESSVFEEWFQKICLPYFKIHHPDEATILISYRHGSHLTFIQDGEACSGKQDDIICLPPHTSHALQPLDVGVSSIEVSYLRRLPGGPSDQQCTKFIFPPVPDTAYVEVSKVIGRIKSIDIDRRGTIFSVSGYRF